MILHGEFHNEEIDNISKLLLDNCTRVTELDSLSKNITESEMKRKYSRWKESTTTSPSGRHLGHWKALYKSPPITITPEETAEFYSMQQKIITLYLQMINYAIDRHYSYK